MKHSTGLVCTFIATALLLATVSIAHATAFRNPVTSLRQGNLGAGFSISDHRQTIHGEYGISDAGTVELLVGNVDIYKSEDALEFGLGYRHDLGPAFDIDGKPVRLAPLARVQYGSGDVGAVTLDFVQVDVGFGGSLAVTPQANVFAGPLLRHVSVEVAGFSDSDTDVGVLLGGEFWAVPQWVVGAELHVGLDEDDFGLYTTLKF